MLYTKIDVPKCVFLFVLFCFEFFFFLGGANFQQVLVLATMFTCMQVQFFFSNPICMAAFSAGQMPVIYTSRGPVKILSKLFCWLVHCFQKATHDICVKPQPAWNVSNSSSTLQITVLQQENLKIRRQVTKLLDY